MNIDTGELVRLSNETPLCPARAFHIRDERVRAVDDHYACSCGCIFEYDDMFHWRVLRKNRDQAMLDGLAVLVESRVAVIAVCREVLVSLSLEGNFEYTVGSKELQEWVGIWIRRFKEAIGES
jgi:hypothetical protein